MVSTMPPSCKYFFFNTPQNGGEPSIRCRIQNTGYQDAQGTHCVLQQYKKDPGRNQSYTSEIKKTLQEINSGVDEAENQINDLEHKEEKTGNQNKKKKESKKMRIG